MEDDPRASRRPGGHRAHPPEHPGVRARRRRRAGDTFAAASNVAKGAYVLAEAARRHARRDPASPPAPRCSSPSRRARRSQAEGINARVVSVPSHEWFEEQDAEYRESVLPAAVTRPRLGRGRPRAHLAAATSATPAAASRSSTSAPPPTTRPCSASSASRRRPSSPPPRNRSRLGLTRALKKRHATMSTNSPTAAALRRRRQHLARRPLARAHRLGRPRRSSSPSATSSASPPTRRSSPPRSPRATPTTTQVARARRRRRRRRRRPSSRSRPTTCATAADVFRPVYDRTGGVDGRVSIEVEPGPRSRHRRHDRRGQAALGQGRPPERDDQDPGDRRGPRGDHRGDRRRHQRQRHADLQPRPPPRGHRRLPRRTRAGQGRRHRPLDDPLGRLVLRVARRHRDRQAPARRSAPTRRSRSRARPASRTRSSPTSSTSRSSRPSGPRRCSTPAPTASGRSGPRPASRTRALPDTLYVTELVAARRRQHDAREDARGHLRPRRHRTATPSPAPTPTRGAVLDALGARRRRLRRRDPHCSRREGVEKFIVSWNELLDTVTRRAGGRAR